MADLLSEELESKTEINNVAEGSVLVDISIQDDEAVDTLKFLSDTGLLSSILESLIITNEFTGQCLAEEVNLHVFLSLDYESGKST